MSNYQRYQTLCAAEQYLYSPSCPVWISRYQISQDMQSSTRLLQCRMVNVAEKAISAVYLRVLCRDAQGQDITTLHMVPLTGLFIPPGDIFGDDQVVTLWPNRTHFAEIYPERVCFSDGGAWNETEVSDYLAIPAPTPVQVQDRNYPRLSMAAREGGVRNEFYFRQLKSVWLCTCGVPNSNQILRCRHCGADRSWLETHMDPEKIEAPVVPALPAPKEEPKQEPKQPEQPELSAPLEEFDLSAYLNGTPIEEPVAEEFPYIETYPEPEEPSFEEKAEPAAAPKKENAGRRIAILLAILLFLGIGAFLAYQQFLGPNADYQKAVQAENDGEYEAAIGLYEELGDYEDAPERILICRAQMALDQMRAENYDQAYSMLSDLPGEFYDSHPEYRAFMPDCLYSAGVLAYNQGDFDTAWSYVGRLDAQYPDYDHLGELHDCTAYEFGKRAIAKAEEAFLIDDRRSAYDEAKNWFVESGSYTNSSEMVNLCDYYLADLLYQEAMDNGDEQGFLRAAEAFAVLGSYSDSNNQRMKCLYAYCASVADLEDSLCADYLDELVAEDYPGAVDLLNALTRLDITVEVVYVDGNGEKALPRELTVGEMQHVKIRFTIDGPGTGSKDILLIYSLPGADSRSVVINPDGSRTGFLSLYEITGDEATETGTATLRFVDEDGMSLYTVDIDIVEPAG